MRYFFQVFHAYPAIPPGIFAQHPGVIPVSYTHLVFGVSKSTIWKDQARLRRTSPGLWAEVQAVVQKNKAERHLRGGEATRLKYLHK